MILDGIPGPQCYQMAAAVLGRSKV